MNMDKNIDFEIPFDKVVLYRNLNDKYNPTGSKLRNYQMQLLEAMKAFDSFCREHEIRYTLAYGSLLGAVRHKGFIPWDDDMDLWMDRENYERLCSLMRGPHHLVTEKIGFTFGTRCVMWYPPYAYIDIFVYDTSPENRLLKAIKQHTAEIVNMLIKCRSRIDKRDFRRPKAWFLFMPLSLLASTPTWHHALKRVSTWFSMGGGKHVQVYNDCVSAIWRTFPASASADILYADFEGFRLPIPAGYDVLLHLRYDDYMSIPKTLHVHGFVDNTIQDNQEI